MDVAAIRKFYKYCMDIGVISTNPVEGLKSLPRDDKLPRPADLTDVAKLFEASETAQDVAMLYMFLNGLRNVEVCRMTLSWISYVPAEETLSLRVIGKGRQVGDVLLSPAAAVALCQFICIKFAPNSPSPVNSLIWFDGWRGKEEHAEELVFGVTRQKVNARVNYLKKKAGIKTKIGPHSLRHTCATEMLERGVDLRVVQEILRHKHITQTVMYTKVRRGPKAAASRTLPSFSTFG